MKSLNSPVEAANITIEHGLSKTDDDLDFGKFEKVLRYYMSPLKY